ncbi:hypothetical protein MNEG_15771, partial [Monoraphidium neglectum]
GRAPGPPRPGPPPPPLSQQQQQQDGRQVQQQQQQPEPRGRARRQWRRVEKKGSRALARRGDVAHPRAAQITRGPIWPRLVTPG